MSANPASQPAPSSAAFNAVDLTRRLIDIESITYNECAVGEFLAEFLHSRGFSVETMPVAQDRGSECRGDRFNVYAQPAGKPPDVVFSTHMDAVPPFIPASEDA